LAGVRLENGLDVGNKVRAVLPEIDRTELGKVSAEPLSVGSGEFNMKAFYIVIAGMLVAAAVLLIFGIPANFLVAALQSRFETGAGYRLYVDGGVTIGLWPSPTVSLTDITVLEGNEVGREGQFKAASARIVLSFADLLRGHTRITQLTISHPSVQQPPARDRDRYVAAQASAPDAESRDSFAIDRILVEDGSVIFPNAPGRPTNRIERINLEATLTSADGPATVTGSFYWAGQMFQVGLKTHPRPQHLAAQTIPVEFSLQAPGMFAQSLSARAELRSRKNALAINALSGRFGQSSFNGWAVIDLAAGKPFVKGELDFDRLQIQLMPDRDHPGRSAVNAPWSDREYHFDGLNFADADLNVSAAELDLGSLHCAPAGVVATINAGVLQTNLVHTELYGGEASGTVSVDATSPIPAHTMHVRLQGVNALPLLSDLADFASLEGIMQASIDMNATGASQQGAISSLNGTVDFQLSGGAVRGIDLSKLMHDLSGRILNGWQQNASDQTRLAELKVSFRLANGIANTDNLELSGPIVRVKGAGSVDLPAKTLNLKIDPRLGAGGQGWDSSTRTTGFGVPIIIQGSWTEPRIYPDVAGIHDDPAGVYNQLNTVGKGLLGESSQSHDNSRLDTFFKGAGKMLNTPR
jgi:AsmA protein